MPQLPTIEDNPQADVVIYDGECRFCTRQVERLARWDRSGRRLAFVSLHDPRVAERWPDLSHEMLMEQMYVVDREGRQRGGAAGFRYLTRRLPSLWALAPLMHLPFTLPLWQWGYRQVAKHRYRLMGKTDPCAAGSCDVHFK
jgi:predicted DCC family thiol-disulfide oxidoreductase YuxK